MQKSAALPKIEKPAKVETTLDGKWLAAGAIVAPPVVTYPLADVARAHADLESGRTVGKLVLVP